MPETPHYRFTESTDSLADVNISTNIPENADTSADSPSSSNSHAESHAEFTVPPLRHDSIPADLRPIVTATECSDDHDISRVNDIGRQSWPNVENTMARKGIEFGIAKGRRPVISSPHLFKSVFEKGEHTIETVAAQLRKIEGLVRTVLQVGYGADAEVLKDAIAACRAAMDENNGEVVVASWRPQVLRRLRNAGVAPDVWQHQLGINAGYNSLGGYNYMSQYDQIIEGSEICFGDDSRIPDVSAESRELRVSKIIERIAQRLHNIVIDTELSNHDYATRGSTGQRALDTALDDFYMGNDVLAMKRIAGRVTGIRAKRPWNLEFDDLTLQNQARRVMRTREIFKEK